MLACSLVAEGHSTRLTCEINTSTCPETNLALQWIASNKEAAQCNKSICGGRYFRQNHFSATYTPTRSELTVNRATRSEGDPFNMETRWECRRCSETIASVTACDKLQIYAPPESPSCTVSEDTESGDIKSVNVSCSTSKVYPGARCRFYNSKNEQTFPMLLLVLLLIISCWTPVEPACSPLREGQPGTLSCAANTAVCPSDNLLIWKAGYQAVAQCVSQGCGAGYSGFSATIDSLVKSTLTINNVSRTDPFDMEVKWICEQCRGDPITACNKLEVYAPPESPSCTVREDTESGDIKSVTVSCSISKVYPKARCRFYREKDGGNSVVITNNPVYSHTETGDTSVYYRSQCSVSVSVQELGEGTHSFTGYIYPGVTGGPAKVTGTPADKTVTLSFSQASHRCQPEAVGGYFLEESTTCTCSLSSVGKPRGTAQWYKGGQQAASNGILVVTRDRSNPEQTYTCEAVSDLGRRLGSTLKAKFAFIDTDSVEVESTPDSINLCDKNNDQARVTCRISKDNVNPEPTFSFSSDGLKFDPSRSGTVSNDGNYYQSQVSLSPDAGGEYQVTCRVTNTVLNIWQEKGTNITFRKPPPAPPQMTIGSESYHGVSPSNTVTLTEGYSGDVQCRVEGGYPAAHTTQLKCGQLVDTGAGNTAALSFTANQLTREMNRAVCTCTSQHNSGCYSNNERQLTLNILYVPRVTFTLDPAQTKFSKGDNLELKCSGQGNPDPTLTLTTKETLEDLSNVKTTELTHTLILDCMDTGVYVCSGQNSQGTNRTEISIVVRCPQQLSPLFNSKPQVDAAIRETAKFGIEIYGFPEPRTLTLERTNNDTTSTYSPRHSVEYTAGVAPFGVVNVTIFDLVEADYVNYTLTVDNGVGNALVYTFYLNKVDAGGPEESIVNEEVSLNISSIVIGVIAVVIITCLIVVIIFLVKKNRGLKKERLDSLYKNTKQSNPQSLKNDDYLVPLEMSTITSHVSTNVPPRPRQYETIDDIPSTTDTTPVSASPPPRPRQYETIDDIPAITNTTPVSASIPPRPRQSETIDDIPSNTPGSAKLPQGTAQYETIENMAITSGTYNSTSRQDVEPLNVYQELETNHLTSGDLGSCGPYSNVPGQHGENLGNPAINCANVDISSLNGNSQNEKVSKQAYQNVEMK